MKLYLTIEYDVLGESTSASDLEESHQELFEIDPLEFINTVWHIKDAQFEYCFESSRKEALMPCSKDIEFDCDTYFYNNADGHICLKYGVLCSAVFCKSLK
jgi:hypothetical protein